jgi:hypothetical protein
MDPEYRSGVFTRAARTDAAFIGRAPGAPICVVPGGLAGEGEHVVAALA